LFQQCGTVSNMHKLDKKDIALLKNSVRSAIRKGFTRSDYYKSFLGLHRIEWYKGKRKRVSFKCNHCGELQSSGNINVDHIIPIGKGVYNSIADASYFYELVFCPYDNLQILCKPCHKVKSAMEKSNPYYGNALF